MKESLYGENGRIAWAPTSINTYRTYIVKFPFENISTEESYLIASNVAYNLQYLEFIRKSLNELRVTSVIKTQQVKTFIITSTSIVEAILFMICKKHKLNYKEWQLVNDTKSPAFEMDGKTFRIENHIYLKSTKEINHEMNLDKMIKKLESKKLLNVSSDFFKNLNYLRKLRNRVHIHTFDDDKSDYRKFWLPEYNHSKKMLGEILLSEYFQPTKEEVSMFNFLVPVKL